MSLTTGRFCSDFAKKIESVEWFCNVGRPFVNYRGPFQIAQVKDAREAYVGLKADAWCNIDLVAFNKLCWNIRHHLSVEAVRDANALAMAAGNLYSEIESSIDREGKKYGLRAEVKPGVQFMLIRACQEGYFVALEPSIKSDFFTSLLDIICLGHLPCGWIGEVAEPLYDPLTLAGDGLNNESDTLPFDYASGTLLVY